MCPPCVCTGLVRDAGRCACVPPSSLRGCDQQSCCPSELPLLASLLLGNNLFNLEPVARGGWVPDCKSSP